MSEFDIGSAIEKTRQQRLAEQADDAAFKEWYAEELVRRNVYFEKHAAAAEELIRGYATQAVRTMIKAGFSPVGRILSHQEDMLSREDRAMTRNNVLIAIHRHYTPERATEGYQEFASSRWGTNQSPSETRKHLWMSLSDGTINVTQKVLFEHKPIVVVGGPEDPAKQPVVLDYRDRLTTISACLLDRQEFSVLECRIPTYLSE